MRGARLFQFCALFAAFLAFLWAAKYALGLSDYLVPPPGELAVEAKEALPRFLPAVLDTFSIALAGHGLAVGAALVLGVLASRAGWLGGLTRTASYNLQAYPVVAVAPIIFLFFGDGPAARILIAALIAYFPLLLTFIGVFSAPVEDVEHFYRATGRLTHRLELEIRAFENLDKIATVLIGTGTLAMVGSIVAEFLAASQGIGYKIRIALYQSNLSRILVALFLIGLVSSFYLTIIEEAASWIRRRLSPSDSHS